MIAIVFDSALAAADAASRVCIAVDSILILLLIGISTAAFMVRPRGDSTAISTRRFLYVLVGSMVLATLDRFVDLVHCALMLAGSLDNDGFYIPFVVEELFCMAACTVLSWCTLFVLDNRAAAVWPAAGWRRAVHLMNMGIVGVSGLLSVLDVAFAAKWVACMTVKDAEGNRGHTTKEMRMEMRMAYHHWGAVLTAAHSWHIAMALYVMVMAAAQYRGAKATNIIKTRNIITLGLVGLYMLIRATNMLVNHALPLLQGAHIEPSTNSMLGQMIADVVPLLLSYVSLVTVGKRHQELRGRIERDDPFADPAPRQYSAEGGADGHEVKIVGGGTVIRSV